MDQNQPSNLVIPETSASIRAAVLLTLNYIQPRSVIQVGCGAGHWLAEYYQQGTPEILGINPTPQIIRDLAIPKSTIQTIEYEQLIHLNQRADLLLCLDTIATIAPSQQSAFIRAITRLSSVILFSSPIPSPSSNQGLNLQWPDYWAAKFKQEGYCVVDCLRESLWQDPNINPEMIQNLFFFVKESELKDYPKLNVARNQTRSYQLSLVHPKVYTHTVNQLVQQLVSAQIESPENSQQTTFKSNRLAKLYFQKKWDDLSQDLIKFLIDFDQHTFLELNSKQQYEIDSFVKDFLYFFTQADYIISDVYSAQFIRFNGLISNVVAISRFKTTDHHLHLLKQQPNNFVKILTLYSARNTRQFSVKSFFDTSTALSSLWYCHIFDIYYSLCADEQGYGFLQQHIRDFDARITQFSNFHHMSFSATYIDPQADRMLKEKINQYVQKNLVQSVQIISSPKSNRVAVISGNWFPRHSVYRNQRYFIEALKGNFELILVAFGNTKKALHTDLFDQVIELNTVNGVLDVSPIEKNEFNLVYFPDVGMNLESIVLSNLRLAPIQVTSYGHSVSTFGSQIDYFIGGAAVEKLEKLQTRYSERVVLIPGLGITNTRPQYQPKGLVPNNEPLIINCSWYSQKANFPMLTVLKKIAETAKSPIIFRLFSGSGLGQQNNYLPFLHSVHRLIDPAMVQVIPPQPYETYMALMEQGDFCLDAFHFGGCNTVIDALYLGKPIVTWEGSHWYNRIGSAILRELGLEELISQNEIDYIDTAIKLVQSPKYRQTVQAKILQLDLDKLIFNPQTSYCFKQAISLLINHHHQLSNSPRKTPILIKNPSIETTTN